MDLLGSAPCELAGCSEKKQWYHIKKAPQMLIWEAFNTYYDNPRLITAIESHEDSQDIKE